MKSQRTIAVLIAGGAVALGLGARGAPGRPAAEDLPAAESRAEALLKEHHTAEAIGAWRDLTAGHVDMPRICHWQTRIAVASGLVDGGRDQVAEVQRLGAVYRRLLEMPAATPADRLACRTFHHDTTKELALLEHKRAQQLKDPGAYRRAERLYDEFLRNFADDLDGVNMRFYHAELLFVLERWEAAADEYDRVRKADSKGKWAKEAAYAALISRKNAMAEDGEPTLCKGAKPCFKREDGPQPIPPAWGRLLEAFDAYLSVAPEAPERAQIAYRKARISYELNRFAEAAPQFIDIVRRHPAEDVAVFSANLYLDALNMQHKTREVCDGVAELLHGPLAARDKELAAQLRGLERDCRKLARDGGASK